MSSSRVEGKPPVNRRYLKPNPNSNDGPDTLKTPKSGTKVSEPKSLPEVWESQRSTHESKIHLTNPGADSFGSRRRSNWSANQLRRSVSHSNVVDQQGNQGRTTPSIRFSYSQPDMTKSRPPSRESKDGSIYESRAPSILATNSVVGSYDTSDKPQTSYSNGTTGSRVAVAPSTKSGRSQSSLGHALGPRSYNPRYDKESLLSPEVRSRSAASFNSTEVMPRPAPQSSNPSFNASRSMVNSQSELNSNVSGKKSFDFGNDSTTMTNSTVGRQTVGKPTTDSKKSISFKQPLTEQYSESQSAAMTLSPKVDHGNANRSVAVSQTASYVHSNNSNPSSVVPSSNPNVASRLSTSSMGGTSAPSSKTHVSSRQSALSMGPGTGGNSNAPGINYDSTASGAGSNPPVGSRFSQPSNGATNSSIGQPSNTHVGSRLSQESLSGASQSVSPQNRVTTYHRGSWASQDGGRSSGRVIGSSDMGGSVKNDSSSKSIYESRSYVSKSITHVGSKSSLSSKPPLASAKPTSSSGSRGRGSAPGSSGTGEYARPATESSKPSGKQSSRGSTYNVPSAAASGSTAPDDAKASRSSGSVKSKSSFRGGGGGGGGSEGGGGGGGGSASRGSGGGGGGGGAGSASKGYASEADADSMGAGGDRGSQYSSAGGGANCERRPSLPAYAKPSTTLMRGGDVDILTPRRTLLTCQGDLRLVGRPGAPCIQSKPFHQYNQTPATKPNPWAPESCGAPWCETPASPWCPSPAATEEIFPEDLEMSYLQDEHLKLLSDYQAFFQQQFSFVRALEHARTPHSWDDARIVEVKSMEHVEYYINKVRRTGNALHSRVMTIFYKIYTGCEVHFNNLLSFYENFLSPVGLTRSERRQVVSKLNELKFLLSKRYNFFNLRVSYPHQQVFRLSVDEAKRLYGGAVSYLPILLDQLDNTRIIMDHIMKSRRNQVPPYLSAPPYYMR